MGHFNYSNLFGIDKERFSVMKLGIEDMKKDYPCEKTDKQYFLSAGRSNRDYSFLCDAWDTMNKSYGGGVVTASRLYVTPFIKEIQNLLHFWIIVTEISIMRNYQNVML